MSLPTNLHPPTLAFNSYTNKFKMPKTFMTIYNQFHFKPIPYLKIDLKSEESIVLFIGFYLINSNGKNIPNIKNEFMMIQFFPHHHIISNFRKSNIAFAVNIYTIPLFNSIRLRDAMNRYRGRYSNLQFSKPRLCPFNQLVEDHKPRNYLENCLSRHYKHWE